MRIAVRLAVAAVLTVAFAAAADAQDRQRGQRQGQGRQPGGFGFGMGGGTPSVYSVVVSGRDSEVNKALADELKITDDQKDKLKEAMKPIAEKRREMFQGINFREMTDEQRKEMREKGEKLAADTKKAVEGALKPEQVKRLAQINNQYMGVNAFTNKDVQAELKIADDQKDKIKAIVDDFTKDQREIMQAAFQGFQPGGDREEMQKKMQEARKKTDALRKDAEEKIAEKLTDEQKTKWKEMTGEKFDTAKLTPTFGGGRRQRDN